MTRTLDALAAELESELVHGILPYWLGRAVDGRHGGFVGLVDGDEVPHPDAPKGAILTARIVWAFSAAHRVLGGSEHADAARRAVDFLAAHLLDAEHGGVRWMVDATGAPIDDRKHVYAQAFAIYALAEHHRATGDASSLARARALYALVERHAPDPVHGGYHEAFGRDWTPLADARLSAVDADERKSVNVHLHLLEAYAGLYRAWPDAALRARLATLVGLFLAHMVDPATGHVHAFFDDDWTPRSRTVSYGHDIETSWLLLDAAELVGDEALRARVRAVSLAMAGAVLAEAADPAHGGIYYERRADGAVDTDKEWWPQAEAIVGFVRAWQESGRAEFLRAALEAWAFTKRHVVDRAHGEWRRRVARDGTPRPGHEKVGPWKCPYHNARACLEIMARAALARGLSGPTPATARPASASP